MRTTRRVAIGGALAGALALPAIPSLMRQARSGQSVLLHDPALAAGRQFAHATERLGAKARPITGDRVRLMRKILADQPRSVTGVSRYADAMLIEDIAREEGYVLAASMDARSGQCRHSHSRAGWSELAGFVSKAGRHWPEALAACAVQPKGKPVKIAHNAAPADSGLVLGWVLTRRG